MDGIKNDYMGFGTVACPMCRSEVVGKVGFFVFVYF